MKRFLTSDTRTFIEGEYAGETAGDVADEDPDYIHKLLSKIEDDDVHFEDLAELRSAVGLDGDEEE